MSILRCLTLFPADRTTGASQFRTGGRRRPVRWHRRNGRLRSVPNAISEHQLCWAHFLRKAIALSLRNPDNQQYARLLKSLFAIYRDAVRFSA